MKVETDPVEDALRLCGITSQHTIDAVVKAEGFDSLDDFGHLFTEKQVTHFVDYMRLSHSSARISYSSARKLRGLAFWVRKRGRHSAMMIDLTTSILDEACRDMDSAYRSDRILSHHKHAAFDIGLGWFKWKNRMLHKLRTMPSSIGGNITLNYIVRPERRPDRGPWDYADYCISLDSKYSKADNKAVALFLADVLMDTPTYAVVREALDTNNGRRAWLQLVGEAESEGRAKQRYEDVSNMVAEVKYTGNESVFPFHEYSAKMRNYFDMLDENGKNCRFESFEKVFIFLDQIEVPHGPRTLKRQIGNLRNDNSLQFEQCVQKMSKIIIESQNLLSGKQQSNGNGRKRKRQRRG
mmetsp:Transcript_20293/g.49746  ORF Transcript_20293/g.49746 Transcript_20293/m.49746 type:complete len:353 (+) Transcript_20293:48-1106(+)